MFETGTVTYLVLRADFHLQIEVDDGFLDLGW